MTELEKIKIAKMYIEQLANGIDPITGIEMPDDTVLNNVRLARYFYYTAEILQQVIDNGGVGSVQKKPFEITESKNALIQLSDTPIPFSVECDNISNTIDLTVYRKLAHLKVTEWLVKKVFLKEIDTEEGKRKTLTETSASVGIAQEDRASQRSGKQYAVNLYDKEAQQFIIEHLDEILGNPESGILFFEWGCELSKMKKRAN